jgi:hypothetical protein
LHLNTSQKKEVFFVGSNMKTMVGTKYFWQQRTADGGVITEAVFVMTDYVQTCIKNFRTFMSTRIQQHNTWYSSTVIIKKSILLRSPFGIDRFTDTDISLMKIRLFSLGMTPFSVYYWSQ